MLGFKEIETINNSYDTCEDFHLIQMEGKVLKDSLSRRNLVQKKKNGCYRNYSFNERKLNHKKFW